MADTTGLGATSAAASALDRQTDALLRRFGTHKTAGKARPEGENGYGAGVLGGIGIGKSSAEKGRIENARIDKSAGEFESILLGTWLQQAEQSFAQVPGGDEEQSDRDPGSEQMQGFAIQSLAGALTASGGIGIAKLIAAQLHKADLDGAKPLEAGSVEPAPGHEGLEPVGKERINPGDLQPQALVAPTMEKGARAEAPSLSPLRSSFP